MLNKRQRQGSTMSDTQMRNCRNSAPASLDAPERMKMANIEVVNYNSIELITNKINFLADSDSEEKHDAFLIGDLSDIVRKHKLWSEQLPRVQPFYAVKCNENDEILTILDKLGAGFDCASKAELIKVLELRVSPKRITYANPCKQSSHIKYAANNDVQMMTFDNEAELHKVHALHPRAKMIVRILPPVNTKCHIPLGMKYGCHPAKVPHLLRIARTLEIDVIGVSFHVGSGCFDADPYSLAIASARCVFDLAAGEGFHFKLLDIGGGFPGVKNAELSFEEIGSVIRLALDTYFPENMNVRIIAEPGRFYVASAFTLAVNVIARRVVTSEDNCVEDYDHKLLAKTVCELSTRVEVFDREHLSGTEEQNRSVLLQQPPSYMYYLNDGVYGSFGDVIFVNAVFNPILYNEDRYKTAPRYASSLWGPTCDGSDCVVKDCLLPELNVGDWLLFEDMGAYCTSISTTFNGMPTPKCHHVIHESDWMFLFKEDVMHSEHHTDSTPCHYISTLLHSERVLPIADLSTVVKKFIFLPCICILAVSLLVW